MNQYVTGAAIRTLREQKKLTQAQLAEKLCVSDKAVSRWETGKGYPDITLLEPLAEAFAVSVTELLSGDSVKNTNLSANMRKAFFYVCPICGNVLCSAGEALINCHGIRLQPLTAEQADGSHRIETETVEDEYFVRVCHEMTKQHYISFLAAVSSDRLQLVKLYPEGGAETRIPMRGVQRIYAYCNHDGLFYTDITIKRKKDFQNERNP